MKDIKISKWLEQFEPYFFYLFILVNLLPVLLFEFFPTVDGPAHLYNANVFLELLSNENSPLNNYYSINPNITPNWTGHLILSFFLLFLPGYLAEKAFVIAYLVLLPIAFRYILGKAAPSKVIISYLIFPFTYSFLFLYGFYNFQLAIVVFLFALGYWVRVSKQMISTKQIAIMTLFATLVCLSHLFVFVTLIITLGLMFLEKHALRSFKENKSQLLKELIPVFIVLLPGIALTISFFLSNPVDQASTLSYSSLNDLLKNIYHVQPIKAMRYGKEANLSMIIFYLLVVLSLFAIYSKIKQSVTKQASGRIVFGLLAILFLLFYFALPNSVNASIGLMSFRFLVFFFIFFMAWLAQFKFPKVVIWIAILATMYVNVALLRIYVNSVEESNQLCEKIIEASNEIPDNAFVLPITNTDHWQYSHISNYLGIDKPMVILENYEASLNHFPIKWNMESFPNLQLGSSANPEDLTSWRRNPKNEKEIIEFVLMIGSKDFSTKKERLSKISKTLASDYRIVYSSNDPEVKLYQLK